MIFSWNTEADMFDELNTAGCITDYYLDDEGEWMVSWHFEKLELLYPDVYDIVWAAHLKEIEETLNGMVDRGLLEMSFRENEDGGIEEVYSATEAGKIVIEGLTSQQE